MNNENALEAYDFAAFSDHANVLSFNSYFTEASYFRKYILHSNDERLNGFVFWKGR